MTLPIYELKISENLNDEAMVDYIALVDAPAIKKDFLAFNEDQKKIMFFNYQRRKKNHIGSVNVSRRIDLPQ